MNEENYSITHLFLKCKEELKQYIEDNIDENHDYFGDYISEIADDSTPHYYHDIFRYASDNPVIQHWEPELTSGNESPDKVIQICIFEYLTAELYNVLDDLIQEVEDENIFAESRDDVMDKLAGNICEDLEIMLIDTDDKVIKDGDKLIKGYDFCMLSQEKPDGSECRKFQGSISYDEKTGDVEMYILLYTPSRGVYGEDYM